MGHRSMAGFTRLTDEALGTVMAPFPWRKRAETGKGEGKGSRRGETRGEAKIFLQIITFNLLVPFIKTNVPHVQT